ncbi:MAG: LysR family transcriptional regulator [Myxococcota bacterium]
MTRPSNLDSMATFAAVVRCGGFTAAARELGVSKQTVSHQIGTLEEHLGVRLLERTTRQVRPTEAGERYYARCVVVVEQAEEARREVQDRLAEPTGLLRIASTVTFGEMYLLDLVSQFLEQWPRVSVDLVLGDRPLNIIDEGFDVAFWFERPDDTSFHARTIGPALTYFVAHPSYLAKYGAPDSSEDLDGARWIEWTSSSRSKSRYPKPTLKVNSPRAALHAARRGIGIARLPSVLVEDDVRSGDLVLLFGGEPASSSDIHAIYPSRRFLPPKVRRFLEHVTREVQLMKPLTAPSDKNPQSSR